MTGAATAYLPPALALRRAWGFALNLYALRSDRNWGIGDFTDLRAFVRFAADAGADVVGVNPLHALHYGDPEAASPYSPTSRTWINPIYLDVEAVPEWADERAAGLRARVAGEPLASTLAALRAEPLVAYARVARAKWSALEALYAVFRERRGERRAAFEAFAAAGGESLERFAVHEALVERFTRERGARSGWRDWPEPFRDAGSAEVRAWAAHERRRVDYFKWLQWLADDQLAAVAREASGLALGLYRDLAVGVDVESADVWSEPSAYALDETVGAPPDPLGPEGQNWGLPPPRPEAMLRDGGRAFRALLRANMAHAGALRLDHAMALLRLFRIPTGEPATEGRYVGYPFDELVAMVDEESRAARCLVVGEDLGNVPEGFRERMERERILSYRLLLFERTHGDEGAFLPAETYPSLALATATTHDVPTLPGWAIGRDVDVRESIGIIDAELAAGAREARRTDAARLLATLERAGELGAPAARAVELALDARAIDRDASAALVEAAYAFLARSPARLVLVQLDDALGELEQVNLPGTHAEYPNWRRKNALAVDAIARDARVAALSRLVRARVEGSPPV